LKAYGGVEAHVHSLLNPTPDDEGSLYVLDILSGGESRVSFAWEAVWASDLREKSVTSTDNRKTPYVFHLIT